MPRVDDDVLDRDEDVSERTDDTSEEAQEARARKNGWISEDDWDDVRAQREGKKKPTRFMSASEFLERIDNETPLLRERNRKLEHTVTRLEGEVRTMGSQVKETRDLLVQQHEMSKSAQKAAYKRGIDDQTKAMRAAVKEGDEEAFDKAEAEKAALEEKIDELDTPGDRRADDQDDDATRRTDGKDKDKPKPQSVEDARSKMNPEMIAWLDDPLHKWFHTDPALNGTMIKYYGAIRNEHPGWSTTEQMEEAERRTRERFPEDFENPARKGNGAVTRGNQEDRGKKGAKTFESLPPDAKQAFYKMERHFKASGKKITKEEYTEEYFNQ